MSRWLKQEYNKEQRLESEEDLWKESIRNPIRKLFLKELKKNHSIKKSSVREHTR